MRHDDHKWLEGGSGALQQRETTRTEGNVRKNPRTHQPLTPVEVLDQRGEKVCTIDVDLNPPRTVDGKNTYKGVFLDKDELGKLLSLGADGPNLVNSAINVAIRQQRTNAVA